MDQAQALELVDEQDFDTRPPLRPRFCKAASGSHNRYVLPGELCSLLLVWLALTARLAALILVIA